MVLKSIPKVLKIPILWQKVETDLTGLNLLCYQPIRVLRLSVSTNSLYKVILCQIFADNINKVHLMIYVLYRVENIVGKEKMLATSIFSFSHDVFLPIRVKSHQLSNDKIII